MDEPYYLPNRHFPKVVLGMADVQLIPGLSELIKTIPVFSGQLSNDKIADMLKEMSAEYVKERQIEAAKQHESDAIEFTLRYIAQPPIKGDITSGKIKYRGIKLITKTTPLPNGGLKTERWLEQRGKIICNISAYTFTINNNTNEKH